MSSVAPKQALLIIFTGATIAGLFVWYIRGKREDERKKRKMLDEELKVDDSSVSSVPQEPVNSTAPAKKSKRSKRSSDSLTETISQNGDVQNVVSSNEVSKEKEEQVEPTNLEAQKEKETPEEAAPVIADSEVPVKENETAEVIKDNTVVASEEEKKETAPVVNKNVTETTPTPSEKVQSVKEEEVKKVKVTKLQCAAPDLMSTKKKTLDNEQIPEEPTPTKFLHTPLSLDIDTQMSPGSFSWSEEMENYNEEDYQVNESSDMEPSPISPSHKLQRQTSRNNRNRKGRGSGSQGGNKKPARRLAGANRNEGNAPQEKQKLANGYGESGVSHQENHENAEVSENHVEVEYEKSDSPGLVSQNSEASSQDSGRATGGLASSLSPMDENGLNGQLADDDLLPMYEFEIPNGLVGLVIGVKGKTIKELSTRTNVRMLIRQHHATEKVNTHQICQVRGKRDEINHCLQMLRRRFPSPRFPDLNLQPVLPPPLPNNTFDMLSTQPTWLTLPDEIKTEVAVSAIINPSHFFIQQPTHASFASLRYLDMYMLRLYGENTNLPEMPVPCQNGLLCAAPVGNAWFRAVTVIYYEETDEVFVKFVDYGGYSRMARQDLRQIRTDLMSLPFQSTEVMLAHVRPVDGTTNWTEAAMKEFSSLCTGKVISCKLVGYAIDTKIPMVELYVPMKDANGEQYEVRYDQVLMDKGMARCADPSKMMRPPGVAGQIGGKRPSFASQTSQNTVTC